MSFIPWPGATTRQRKVACLAAWPPKARRPTLTGRGGLPGAFISQRFQMLPPGVVQRRRRISVKPSSVMFQSDVNFEQPKLRSVVTPVYGLQRAND